MPSALKSIWFCSIYDYGMLSFFSRSPLLNLLDRSPLSPSTMKFQCSEWRDCHFLQIFHERTSLCSCTGKVLTTVPPCFCYIHCIKTHLFFPPYLASFCSKTVKWKGVIKLFNFNKDDLAILDEEAGQKSL